MRSFILFALVFSYSIASFAQASFFDATFGTGGKVILDGGGVFRAVGLQADGKIVVGGGMPGGEVARFRQDGIIDSSFGINGVQDTHIYNFAFNDLVIQPDDKIVGMGRNYPSFGSSDFVAFRLLPSGAPDASFGVGGVVVVDYEGYNDYGHSVALQADGKVLLAGQFNSNKTGIVRLHTNGTVDSSFGTNGIVIAGYDGTYYVDVAPDGKIVLGGTSSAAHDYTICAMRFLSDGTVDTSFNHTGVVYTAAGDFRSNHGTSIKVQPDGRVLVAGYGTFGSEGANFVLVRYNTNGSLDNSFGTGGIANVDFDGEHDTGGAIALGPDGKIILAGATGEGYYNTKVALAYLRSDGVLDAAWGNAGRITSVWRGIVDGASDIALQADGKIVVVGPSYREPVAATQDPAIARYTSLPGSVHDNLILQGDILYPNPAKDKLYVSNSISGRVVSINAYNSVGKMAAPLVTIDGSVDVSDWANGLYFFSVITDDGSSSTQKIVIKN